MGKEGPSTCTDTRGKVDRRVESAVDVAKSANCNASITEEHSELIFTILPPCANSDF